MSTESILGNRDGSATGEIGSGHGACLFHDLIRRAVRDDLTAFEPGPRPQIDQPVSLSQRILIVLDDKQGVAEVRQLTQGFQQALVVTLMESDGGFIEHVHDPSEPTSDLRCEPDALGLSA